MLNISGTISLYIIKNKFELLHVVLYIRVCIISEQNAKQIDN